LIFSSTKLFLCAELR